MLGSIAGDIIGSVYEANGIKSKLFDLFSPDMRFTDDSVLTIALADAILSGDEYGQTMRGYYRRYPDVGYGGSFHKWASNSDNGPYNSWGNGSAMRTSPVGYAYHDLDEVLRKADYYASFTHNHPEGVKGAQAVASSIFLARNGASKDDIALYVNDNFHYDLTRSLDEIRPGYEFDVSCQGSVPQAILAFIESDNYEDAIRNAVSLGGDSDTQACIAGGIAEAFYGKLPDRISRMAMNMLDDNLRGVVDRFHARYIVSINHVSPTIRGVPGLAD